MRIAAFAAVTLLMASAALAQTPAGAPTPRPPPLMLSSSGLEDGGMVPDKYTAASKTPVSPPLAWTNVPAATQSFVLIVHDQDVVMQHGMGDFAHWVIFNIPATATSLPEGLPNVATLPDGSIQVKNRVNWGYFPFAPPPPFVHHYVFELYALDTKLPLDANAVRADVEKAMDGHIVGKAVLDTRFKR